MSTRRQKVLRFYFSFYSVFWCRWNTLSAIINFPPVPIKGILAKLRHHMREIDGDIVVDDLPVDNLPEVHVADLDPLACGSDSHELPRMVRLLPSKGSGPLSHVEASFIDAHLVRESSLEDRIFTKHVLIY